MSAPEKKDQTKRESQRHPQDHHVGAQGSEKAIEGQRYRNGPEGSAKQGPGENGPNSPPIKRWLDEAAPAEPFPATLLQKGKDEDPESHTVKARSTNETSEDIAKSAPA